MAASLALFCPVPGRSQNDAAVVTAEVEAEAEATTRGAAPLKTLVKKLSSSEGETRKAAAGELAMLGSAQLGAIEDHLKMRAERRAPRDAVLAAMTRFRTIQGKSSPSDPELDMAAGVLPTLAERRDEATVQAAESMLLLRSLEAIGGVRAAELAMQIFALDAGPWKWEARRSTARFGADLLPVVLQHRLQHPRRHVRSWCNWSLEALGMPSPGQAVAGAPRARLVALLKAWGRTRNHEALPVLVSFLGDGHRSVRTAAREALEAFGKRARWALRDGFLSIRGESAPANWGAARLLESIAKIHEAPRRERAAGHISQARHLLKTGKPRAAVAALKKVHRGDTSRQADTDLRTLFAACGEALIKAGELDMAHQAFRRALHGTKPGAKPNWLAQHLWLESELRLRQGWPDVRSLEQALEAEPGHHAASEALDVVSGAKLGRQRRYRAWAAWSAAALLLALAVFLLRPSRRLAEALQGEDGDEDELPEQDHALGESC